MGGALVQAFQGNNGDAIYGKPNINPDPEPTPRISPYAKPWAGDYQTHLTPAEELEYQAWSTANPQYVRGETGKYADYDVRGLWKAQRNLDPRAVRSLNQNDGKMHAPDIWKTPYHRSFSNESIYAKPDAPHWEGDTLVDKNGSIVFDERKK